jgi:site-specific DNA-methyltransferase (adenine-specific)
MSTPWKRVEQIGDCTLYLGDCLEILPALGKVDAVVTDPPYCSGARTSALVRGRGGMSRKAKWKSSPLANDQMTVTGFIWTMRAVALLADSLLPDGASFLSFVDWRQYPTLYAALESANYRVQTMVVWDKMDMGMGNGFRNQHELIIHAAKGTPIVYDRGVPNVLRCKRISSSDDHPTEKPTELLGMLLDVVSEPGSIVLDPFMGSGTTGVACAKLGRRFVGIEIDPGYFEIACRRIREVYAQGDLFREPAHKAEQTTLGVG